jgi:hypothetical protein
MTQVQEDGVVNGRKRMKTAENGTDTVTVYGARENGVVNGQKRMKTAENGYRYDDRLRVTGNVGRLRLSFITVFRRIPSIS